MGFGDRIAVLNQGRVRQIGTPHEVYGYPADIFAATFIGSPPMNLIEDGKTWIGFLPEPFLPQEFEPNCDTVNFPFRIPPTDHPSPAPRAFALTHPPPPQPP